eukprot:scaffold239060_cov26-Tisochrysis_lutea.AAC.4
MSATAAATTSGGAMTRVTALALFVRAIANILMSTAGVGASMSTWTATMMMTGTSAPASGIGMPSTSMRGTPGTVNKDATATATATEAETETTNECETTTESATETTTETATETSTETMTGRLKTGCATRAAASILPAALSASSAIWSVRAMPEQCPPGPGQPAALSRRCRC